MNLNPEGPAHWPVIASLLVVVVVVVVRHTERHSASSRRQETSSGSEQEFDEWHTRGPLHKQHWLIFHDNLIVPAREEAR